MKKKIIKSEVDITKAMKKGVDIFKTKANKFSGHLFAEVVKKGIEEEGFRVSKRDVFIQNLKSEIDLLLIKEDAKPYYDLIYSPVDVLFAFELKANGSYGEETISGIMKKFAEIKKLNPDIHCIYLTFTERMIYKHTVTEENIGHKIVELFPREKGNLKEEDSLKENGNWQELITHLKERHNENM